MIFIYCSFAWYTKPVDQWIDIELKGCFEQQILGLDLCSKLLDIFISDLKIQVVNGFNWK